MGSTPVGGSENSFSEYFDLRTLLHYLHINAIDVICYDSWFLRSFAFRYCFVIGKNYRGDSYFRNRPRSIYQYSNMAPRLLGQTSIFGVVFFVFESLLGIERQKKLKKFTILTRKPRSRDRILIYRTWPILW